MKSRVHLKAGVFYTLEDGAVLLYQDQGPGDYVQGAKFSSSALINVFELLRDGRQVGFYFTSPYPLENRGSVLLAVINTKRGRATSAHLVLRHEWVTVFELTGCGAMAISAATTPEMQSILSEQ